MAEDGGTMGWKQPGTAFSPYIIAKASSNNIFVDKSGGGVKGSPISRHKWGLMAKNGIFRQMAGDGGTMGWKQPGIAFSPYVLLQ